MKKQILAGALGIFCFSNISEAAMSQAAALAKAKFIWGQNGAIGMQGITLPMTPQIGYIDKDGVFRVVAEGISYDAAFAKLVAMNYVPPVKGFISAKAVGNAVQFKFNGIDIGEPVSGPPYSINLDTVNPPKDLNKGIEVEICNSPCFVPKVTRVKPNL